MKRHICFLLILCLSLFASSSLAGEKAEDAAAEHWIIEKATEQTGFFDELVHGDGYIGSVFSSSVMPMLLDVRTIQYSAPVDVLYIPFGDVLPSSMVKLALIKMTGTVNMSEAEQAYLSRMLVEMLPLQWLGASEAEMIALISALTVSDAYIAPEYVEESAYVLFLYEGEFALLAAFNHLDTGVITSTLRLMPLDALYALLPL